MEKVKKLYRGISVTNDVFDSLDFNSDIVPPNPPKYDEKGRKVVFDGNEYGVYMTDNITMALNTYGNCHNLGNKLGFIGNHYFALPRVGVTYEIDTDGVDVRKPWITSTLKGVYNNGFSGDEWIADKIPVQNVTIIRIMVGADVFNPERTIELTGSIDSVKANVRQIIKKREEGMRLCMKYLQTHPKEILGYDAKLYAEIFGEDGVAMQIKPNANIQTPHDLIKEMMRLVYNKNKEDLNMPELKYLYNLKSLSYNISDLGEFATRLEERLQRERQIVNMQRSKNINTRPTENRIELLNKLIDRINSMGYQRGE